MNTLKKAPLDVEQLAHELIKDDLINCRLIYGLKQLRLNADNYLLYLSETVFLVLGYEREDIPEPLWDAYYKFTHEKASLPLEELNESLDQLASEILAVIIGMMHDMESSANAS